MGMPFFVKDKCQWIDCRFNYHPDFYEHLHPFAWPFKRFANSRHSSLKLLSRISKKINDFNEFEIRKGLSAVLPKAYYWHFAGGNKHYINYAVEFFAGLDHASIAY